MATFTNQNGDLSFGGLVNAIQNIEDSTSMSLFQYTRRSIVNSRVYIDNTLAEEDILTPVMQNIMNLACLEFYNPFTIVVLPTPASPTRQGLAFSFLLSTSVISSMYSSTPMTFSVLILS